MSTLVPYYVPMRASNKKRSRTSPGGEEGAPRSDRREALLDGLEEIFLKQGFREIGVGELAGRLRCSRRSLYALAPSKQELFLLVLDRFLHRIRRLGREQAFSRTDPGDRIEAFLEPGITETRLASEAFTADVASYAPARRLLDEHQRARMELLREIVEDGHSRGLLRGLHPYLVAEVMLAAVARARDPRFLQEAGLSMSEAFEECSQLLRHGLLHTRD